MSIKNIFLICLLSMFFNSSVLANYVATVKKLNGSATIQRASKKIDATLGIKILEKDRILTKKDSSLMLLFKDKTVITIGKNSDFVIKDFLYGQKIEPKARFGLFSGAINTITGKIGKIAPDKFKIELKTTTIGIRGTKFGVITGANNAYLAYCTYGAISVNDAKNNKEYIVKNGYFLNATSKGKIVVKKFNDEKIKNIEKNSFTIDTKTSNIDIRNSSIKSNITVGKNTQIKDSNIGTSIKSKNINIKDSTIMSTTNIGASSVIKNSNLGTSLQSDSLDIE